MKTLEQQIQDDVREFRQQLHQGVEALVAERIRRADPAAPQRLTELSADAMNSRHQDLTDSQP